MATKSVNYSEAQELKKLADELVIKYNSVLGYLDTSVIFFAFKGGDLPQWFNYEVLGLKNDWVKYSTNSINEPRLYCIAMTYDFYQKAQGALLEWTMLDLLYCVHPKQNGKLRTRDIHEHSRIISTLEDIGESVEWRENIHLPQLLGDEVIVFGVEDITEEEE
jgi:hypothetical protein